MCCKKGVIPIVGLVLLGMSLSAEAQNRPEVRRTIEETIPIRTATAVLLDHESGNMTVRTHASPEMHVTASARVSAKSRPNAAAFAEAIAVEATEDAGMLTIRIVRPAWTRQNRDVGFVIDLDVVVPSDRHLTARHRFGNLSASGLGRGATLVNRQGRLTVSDIQGDCRVENEFGPIDVRDVVGNLTVAIRCGRVTIQNVRGAVTLNGEIHAADVRGTKTLETR